MAVVSLPRSLQLAILCDRLGWCLSTVNGLSSVVRYLVITPRCRTRTFGTEPSLQRVSLLVRGSDVTLHLTLALSRTLTLALTLTLTLALTLTPS